MDSFIVGYAIAFLKVCLLAVAIMAGLAVLGKIYLRLYRRLEERHAEAEAEGGGDGEKGAR